MKELFYFEMKNKNGKYEPLGVMTHLDAVKHSWENDHATLRYVHVRDLSPAETH